MKIVVTGANGFIGYSVLAALRKKYPAANILGITGPSGKFLEPVRKRATSTLVWDRTASLEPPLELLNDSPICVYDCAGIVSRSPSDTEQLVQVNLKSAKALVVRCSEIGIPCVYVSSAGVYGGKVPNVEEQDEFPPTNDPYVQFKKELDDFVRDKALSGVVGIRPFNVYGPFDWRSKRASFLTLAYCAVRWVETERALAWQYPDSLRRDFVEILEDMQSSLLSEVREAYRKETERNTGCD